MNFTRLVEDTLSQPPEYVLLFQGTSSGRIAQYLDQGIFAPHGSIKRYMYGVAMEYLQSVGYTESALPTVVKHDIDFYISDVREKLSGMKSKDDHCIYTSFSYNTAEVYASKFQRLGSEARKNATEKAYSYAVRNSLIDWDTPMPMEFPDGKPLIVALKVPVRNTNIPPDLWREWYTDWKSDVSKTGHEDIPYQSWFFNKWEPPAGEVRVYRDIPDSDIFWGLSGSWLPDHAQDELILRIVGT